MDIAVYREAQETNEVNEVWDAKEVNETK